MAAPKKKTVDYFPHFTRPGKTLFILEAKWGNDGYAFWFKLLETLGATEGHVCNFNDAAQREYLLARTGADAQTANDILSELATLGNLDGALWAEGLIWCQSFVDNVEDAYKKRLSDLPQRPVSSTENPMERVNPEEETPREEQFDTGNGETKVKERKENKSREKVKSISPDGDYLDQILALFLHEYESEHGKPYLIVNRGKERRAVGVLLRAHRAEIKASGTSPPDSDETKRQFQALFRAAVRVNDPWLHNNMSPTILASKINEILRKIENGSGGKVQSKLDSSFFERLQRDGFIQGAAGRR